MPSVPAMNCCGSVVWVPPSLATEASGLESLFAVTVNWPFEPPSWFTVTPAVAVLKTIAIAMPSREVPWWLRKLDAIRVGASADTMMMPRPWSTFPGGAVQSTVFVPIPVNVRPHGSVHPGGTTRVYSVSFASLVQWKPSYSSVDSASAMTSE